MKNIVFLILINLIFISSAFAQGFHGPERRDNRLIELERMKLIETLNLEEETSVRFFARRNEHQNKMKSLADARDSLLNNLASEIENDGDDSLLKKKYDEVFKLEGEILQERERFFESLDDILNPIEKAKLLVFEHKFRRELRKLLMKERMGRGRGRQ